MAGTIQTKLQDCALIVGCYAGVSVEGAHKAPPYGETLSAVIGYAFKYLSAQPTALACKVNVGYYNLHLTS